MRLVWRLLKKLKEFRNIKQIMVLEVLHRKHPVAWPMRPSVPAYNRQVGKTNDLLQAVAQYSFNGVDFCQHSRQLHHPRLVGNDDVHLTAEGVAKYWRSVRGAILSAVRTTSRQLQCFCSISRHLRLFSL